jgi:glycosidase
MPKWNADDPAAREYLLNAARYWAEEYGIDGWRLDVANEVSHDFWRGLRKAVKRANPDALLVGENWDNAAPWLNGDQFDSAMNYPMLGAVSSYANGKTDAAGFAAALTKVVLAAYPKPVRRALFNMLDTHDTQRIMTACGGNAKKTALAYVLLMTLPGSPSVYYGGEIGLEGRASEDENRRCMPWDEPVRKERDFRPSPPQAVIIRSVSWVSSMLKSVLCAGLGYAVSTSSVSADANPEASVLPAANDFTAPSIG